jgi:ATP-dependent Lon protease
MPCDASHVLFVATANDMDMISVPLLSRFVTMSIEMPNSEQQKAVAHSVYQSVLSQEGVTELFDSELPPAVLSVLSAFSPRQIKLMLVRAVAKASLRLDSQKLTQIDLKDLIKPLDERDRPVGFIW